MSMSSARAKVLDAFREEAGERLDRIVEGLLALERGIAGSDAIDALFREAHSIKGSAGMMGFDEVDEIGHALEDVLAQARANGFLDPDLVQPLLDVTDGLRRAVSGTTGVSEDALAALASAGSVRPAVTSAEADEAPHQARGERRSMRVDAERVDRLLDAVGETLVQHRRLEHALTAPAGGSACETPEELMAREDRLLDDLRDAAIRLRTVPISSMTGPFPRAVRDLAARQGKQVQLVIEGADSQLDRTVLEGTSEAIVHLLRNAVAHGVEPPAERQHAGKPREGRIELRAEQRGDRVAIAVSDDGRGVAPELVRAADGPEALAALLSQAGMSTADTVTEVSGRGVGLDAVKTQVESVGGTLEVHSVPGQGTTVSLLLPMHLALLDVLLVERGGLAFAIPIAAIGEAIEVSETVSLMGRPAVNMNGQAVPVADLVGALGGSAAPPPSRPPAIVLARGQRRVALICDRLVGEEAMVVKRLGSVLADVPGYLGGAVMGDGRVALVVDPHHLLSVVAERRVALSAATPQPTATTVLVVDDQFTVRELQRSILETSGYRVETARDGVEAWERLSSRPGIHLVVTDLEMPGMDGLELLGAIRRHAELSTLPVVIVTSRSGDEDERRGLEAGADAYIVKQRFDQQTLLESVERLVGR